MDNNLFIGKNATYRRMMSEETENDPVIMKGLAMMKNVVGFERVKFVILYGSYHAAGHREGSDIDLAVGYDAKTNHERSAFRLNVLSKLPKEFDVQIFEQLPVYVRKEVLKGKAIFCSDENYLYEAAFSTIREFEDFKRHFYDYIGQEAITA